MMLIYSDATFETGERLARCLNFSYCHRPYGEMPDVLVRWGTTVPARGRLEINSRMAVVRTCNKGLMVRILRDAGVRTPLLALSIRDPRLAFNGYDLVLRTPRGGVMKIRSKDEAVAALGDHYLRMLMRHYIMHAIDVSRELRLYVWRGQTLFIDEKVPRLHAFVDPFVRKLAHGWSYQTLEGDGGLPADLRVQAGRAVIGLGLDFGAVDAAVDSGGKVWVFEVNSAPGMTTKKCLVLAEKIKEVLP